jgi:hypothetical protein
MMSPDMWQVVISNRCLRALIDRSGRRLRGRSDALGGGGAIVMKAARASVWSVTRRGGSFGRAPDCHGGVVLADLMPPIRARFGWPPTQEHATNHGQQGSVRPDFPCDLQDLG